MIIGCTADLYYGFTEQVSRRVETCIERVIAPASLDLLLLAGDIADSAGLSGAETGSLHERLLARVRDAAGGPIAFCAGNRDPWTTDQVVWMDAQRIHWEWDDVPLATIAGVEYLNIGGPDGAPRLEILRWPEDACRSV